jgi:hypothetical protein
MRRRDDWELQSYLITLAFIAVIWILSALVGSISDAANWNDGYHECGGKWMYQQAVGHYYTTSYLYECEKCGETHEFNKQR